MKFTVAIALALTQLLPLAGATASDREPPKLDKTKPLGSAQNPVRANMPTGQHEFLMRLRCPEGDASAFTRSGSLRQGAYGNTVDSHHATG